MTVASLWKALDHAGCGKPVGEEDMIDPARHKTKINPWTYNEGQRRHQRMEERPSLAIDLSIWICESLTSTDMNDHNENPVLYLVFARTMKLLSLGIKLVVVIEGKRRIRASSNNDSKDKFRRRRSGTSFWKACKQCETLLGYLGVPVVKAAAEGEALCALLNQKGIVDGVISNDGDCLLFGAKVVYTKFSNENLQKGCIMKYEASQLYAIADGGVSNDTDGECDGPEGNTNAAAATTTTTTIQGSNDNDNSNNLRVSLSRHDLVAFALLTGSDLAGDGIDKIGYKKALRFIRKCKIDYPLSPDTASMEELQSWGRSVRPINDTAVDTNDENNNDDEIEDAELDQSDGEEPKTKKKKTKKKESCCSRCHHVGSKRSHEKHGCSICDTKPGEPCIKLSSDDKFRKSLRAKALALRDPKFDPTLVINAYMRPNDNQLPAALVCKGMTSSKRLRMAYPRLREIIAWRTIVKGHSLQASQEYVKQSVARLLARTELFQRSSPTGDSGNKTTSGDATNTESETTRPRRLQPRERPIPKEITRKLVQNGIDCYEVLYSMQATITDQDGEGIDGYEFSNVEPRDMVNRLYPQLVDAFNKAPKESKSRKQGMSEMQKRREFVEEFFQPAGQKVPALSERCKDRRNFQLPITTKQNEGQDDNSRARRKQLKKQRKTGGGDVEQLLRFTNIPAKSKSKTSDKVEEFDFSSLESGSLASEQGLEDDHLDEPIESLKEVDPSQLKEEARQRQSAGQDSAEKKGRSVPHQRNKDEGASDKEQQPSYFHAQRKLEETKPHSYPAESHRHHCKPCNHNQDEHRPHEETTLEKANHKRTFFQFPDPQLPAEVHWYNSRQASHRLESLTNNYPSRMMQAKLRPNEGLVVEKANHKKKPLKQPRGNYHGNDPPLRAEDQRYKSRDSSQSLQSISDTQQWRMMQAKPQPHEESNAVKENRKKKSSQQTRGIYEGNDQRLLAKDQRYNYHLAPQRLDSRADNHPESMMQAKARPHEESNAEKENRKKKSSRQLQHRSNYQSIDPRLLAEDQHYDCPQAQRLERSTNDHLSRTMQAKLHQQPKQKEIRATFLNAQNLKSNSHGSKPSATIPSKSSSRRHKAAAPLKQSHVKYSGFSHCKEQITCGERREKAHYINKGYANSIFVCRDRGSQRDDIMLECRQPERTGRRQRDQAGSQQKGINDVITGHHLQRKDRQRNDVRRDKYQETRQHQNFERLGRVASQSLEESTIGHSWWGEGKADTRPCASSFSNDYSHQLVKGDQPLPQRHALMADNWDSSHSRDRSCDGPAKRLAKSSQLPRPSMELESNEEEWSIPGERQNDINMLEPEGLERGRRHRSFSPEGSDFDDCNSFGKTMMAQRPRESGDSESNTFLAEKQRGEEYSVGNFEKDAELQHTASYSHRQRDSADAGTPFDRIRNRSETGNDRELSFDDSDRSYGEPKTKRYRGKQSRGDAELPGDHMFDSLMCKPKAKTLNANREDQCEQFASDIQRTSEKSSFRCHGKVMPINRAEDRRRSNQETKCREEKCRAEEQFRRQQQYYAQQEAHAAAQQKYFAQQQAAAKQRYYAQQAQQQRDYHRQQSPPPTPSDYPPTHSQPNHTCKWPSSSAEYQLDDDFPLETSMNCSRESESECELCFDSPVQCIDRPYYAFEESSKLQGSWKQSNRRHQCKGMKDIQDGNLLKKGDFDEDSNAGNGRQDEHWKDQIEHTWPSGIGTPQHDDCLREENSQTNIQEPTYDDQCENIGGRKTQKCKTNPSFDHEQTSQFLPPMLHSKANDVNYKRSGTSGRDASYDPYKRHHYLHRRREGREDVEEDHPGRLATQKQPSKRNQRSLSFEDDDFDGLRSDNFEFDGQSSYRYQRSTSRGGPHKDESQFNDADAGC